MALQILPVDPHLVEVSEGVKIDMPSIAFIGLDGEKVIGSGGLAWGGGRCWIWLRVSGINPAYALPIMRQTKRLIAKARQFGETEVFSPRDAEYPTSKKLLTVLGFTLHGIENEIEVWSCRV